MEIWQKNDIFQIQDGGRTPLLKNFLAISQRNIGKFMQISEWRWRITVRYRSLDQSGNFRKFKMAEGRHFENSFFILISVGIIRFRATLVCRCKFPFREWLFDKKNRFFFQIQDGGRTPYWKWFFAISRLGALLANRREIRKGDEESHANTGHLTKTAIFPNWRWRKAAILKTVFGVYVILLMK